MKSFATALFAGILLIAAAFGIARISQLLAAHIPWPLHCLLIGGALGAGAGLIWQQRWVSSWPLMLTFTLFAAACLGVAEHYFAWQQTIAAQEAEWLATIRAQPHLGTFPMPFEPPTFAQFMSGGSEPLRTWAWWGIDAAAKALVAVAVLVVRRNSALSSNQPAGATL